MSSLKLHKTQVMGNTFIQEKLLPWLTFNPGLTLTCFRTMRPRSIFFRIITRLHPLPMPLFMSSLNEGDIQTSYIAVMLYAEQEKNMVTVKDQNCTRK